MALILVAALAGCGEPASPNAADPVADAVPAGPANHASPAAPPPPAVSAVPPAAADPVLEPAGYDSIRIGGAPAEAAGYALADDGTFEDVCRIYTSRRVRGFYAIVENGIVTRLTIHADPDGGPPRIRTGRGIGVGSSEAEVRAAYSPLREQPHHYVTAPAKDLFFGGSEQAPGLRFEIGADGRVSLLHAGLMPALAYVEGCA